MNPLFLLLLAGGAVAVATGGRKKRTTELWCGQDEEGLPRLYFGDEGSVALPSNVDVVGWRGNDIVASCPATNPPRNSRAPTIKVAWQGGRELRELMDQVIIPAALTNPDIIFDIWTGRPWAGSNRAVEVFIDGPDWGPYQEGNRIRLMFVSQHETNIGYQEFFASVMDAGSWVQRGITLIKDAQAFNWAGNGVHITDSCDFLVGEQFLPDPDSFTITASLVSLWSISGQH